MLIDDAIELFLTCMSLPISAYFIGLGFSVIFSIIRKA